MIRLFPPLCDALTILGSISHVNNLYHLDSLAIQGTESLKQYANIADELHCY